MKASVGILKGILYFSHWCGKGYAVFAALGKEVHISGLAIHICICSLQKSARKGVITTMAACWPEEVAEAIAENRQKRNNYLGFKAGEVCPVCRKT